MSINQLLPLLLLGSMGGSTATASASANNPLASAFASASSSPLSQLSGMFGLPVQQPTFGLGGLSTINQGATTINNFFLGQMLGLGGLMCPPPVRPQPAPISSIGGGLDITTLLLLMLLLNNGGDNNPLGNLLSIIRPSNPGSNPNTGSGWGDPHFLLPWIRANHVDFHGTGLTANGGKADYRMYDNGSSAINAQFNGQDGKPTIINEVGGRIGKDVTFHYDTDNDKLMVNGKELKKGESVRATGTGIFLPNGQEAAGWIMLDNSGKVIVNTGDAQFDWKKEGSWQGMNYTNLNFKVLEAGTSAAKRADGKANALGGIFGSSISTGKDIFKGIASKSQAEIDTILDKALRLNGITDVAGQKFLEGQAATQDYNFGTNANVGGGANA